jgi:methylmalonyl-CoA mutase
LKRRFELEQPDLLAAYKRGVRTTEDARVVRRSGAAGGLASAPAGSLAAEAAARGRSRSNAGPDGGNPEGNRDSHRARTSAHRYGERFEELRDASDASQAKTGERPKIFLANLGPVAKHTGSRHVRQELLRGGGHRGTRQHRLLRCGELCCCIQVTAEPRSPSSAPPISVYETMAETVAPALKAAGCSYLFLAGNPGDKKDAYKAAGVDDFIFMGGDLLQTTRSTLARLGVI